MKHETDCKAFCPDSCNADHTHFDENDCSCPTPTPPTEKFEKFVKENPEVYDHPHTTDTGWEEKVLSLANAISGREPTAEPKELIELIQHIAKEEYERGYNAAQAISGTQPDGPALETPS